MAPHQLHAKQSIPANDGSPTDDFTYTWVRRRPQLRQSLLYYNDSTHCSTTVPQCGRRPGVIPCNLM
jgi:hypothetical protein